MPVWSLCTSKHVTPTEQNNSIELRTFFSLRVLPSSIILFLRCTLSSCCILQPMHFCHTYLTFHIGWNCTKVSFSVSSCEVNLNRLVFRQEVFFKPAFLSLLLCSLVCRWEKKFSLLVMLWVIFELVSGIHHIILLNHVYDNNNEKDNILVITAESLRLGTIYYSP